MARLAATYRYPLKGFSPEALAEIVFTEGGGVPGDRVWALENGPSGFDPESPHHIPKSRFLVLARHPRLALVRTRFNADVTRIAVEVAERRLELDLSRAAGRRRLEEEMTRFLEPEARGGAIQLLRHETHRFTDDPEGQVSLVNAASVRDLETRMGHALDPLRFRANLYVEGLEPWSERTWAEGARVRIGDAEFVVFKPIIRCLATHVDPQEGVVDAPVVPALFANFGHRICGVYLRPSAAGRARPGDPMEIFS